jgi:hypothetical protein
MAEDLSAQEQLQAGRRELPTTGQAIPEFQFVLGCNKDALDEPYVLVRHVASGKIYDSRDCPKISTGPKMCQQLLRAIWFMWVDQGKPETDFYMDVSDGPNYKPAA